MEFRVGRGRVGSVSEGVSWRRELIEFCRFCVGSESGVWFFRGMGWFFFWILESFVGEIECCLGFSRLCIFYY